jgi:hypothetical protein
VLEVNLIQLAVEFSPAQVSVVVDGSIQDSSSEDPVGFFFVPDFLLRLKYFYKGFLQNIIYSASVADNASGKGTEISQVLLPDSSEQEEFGRTCRRISLEWG